MAEQHPAVAFLLAAHRQAEGLAQAADREAPDHCPSKPVEFVLASCEISTWVTEAAERHVRLYDPAAVLRRVAAEREILAEHQPTREAKWRGPGSWDPCELPGCPCTKVAEDSPEAWSISGCGMCASGPWYDAVVEHWPCRTVLLLAEAWGWTEETS